jgi:hypothetical protein
MYEFHGWATIRETYSNSEENIEEVVKKIKKFIEGLNWNSGLIDLRAINGEYQLSISGMTNHRGKDAEDVFKLFNFVSGAAKGSYGILYVRDDEDKNGYENEFQVFVLAKGKISQKEDLFLSPCIPVVEE